MGEKRKLRAARGSGITATKGASKMLRATGHARMVTFRSLVALLNLHNPVARAALPGREQASRAAREGLNWFSIVAVIPDPRVVKPA